MALGGSNDIDIKIRVDDQGAVTILDALGNKVKQVGTESNTASGAFGGFTGNLASMAGKAAIAGAAIYTAYEAIKKLGEIAQEGDKINDAADAFSRLSARAGVASDTLLNKLNVATKETISDFNLMKSANDGLQAGLSPEALVTLATAAKRLGDQVGIDTKQAFDGLTQAVESGRVGILKQYGIMVDAEYVVNRYANSQNKLASEISETTRVHLLQEEALRLMEVKLGSLGASTEGAGDKVDTLSKRFGDLYGKIAKSIDNSSGLKSLFDDIATGAKHAGEAYDYFFGKVDQTNTALKNNSKYLGENAAFLTAVGKGLKDNAAKEEQLKEAAAKHQKAIEDARKKQEEYRLELEKLKTPQGLLSIGAAYIQTIKASAELNQSFEEQDAALEQLNRHWIEVGMSVEQVIDLEIAALDREIDKIKEKQAALKGDSGGFQAGKTGFGESVINAFGGDGKKYGAMGEQIGAALMHGIEAAFSAKTGKDWQKAAGDLVGGISDAIIPGSGQFVTPITNAIVGLFIGEDSAATKARKQLDKWLGDLFEAHHIEAIINGKLKEITNIEFFGGDFGNRDKGFFDSFDKLGAKAAGAFGAIGSAFAALMGQTQELAGNFAAALSTNMGGSLNNLQQLIVATGLTFSQFGDALWAAFNKGQLSAMQLEQELMNLRDLMTKGIPGAVGAVKQAWANMQVALDAGPKGAQALIDAIGDIAAEANDLRIKSLPALRAAMINNFGISAKAADDFFKALKVAGVNSFEDLKNASKETLLAIAANLEAIKKGLSVTFGVVKDPTATTTTPSSSGSSHIGGGSTTNTGPKPEDIRRARQEAIDALTQGSGDYKTAVDNFNKHLIDSNQLQLEYLKARNAAEKLYDAEIKAHRRLTAIEEEAENTKNHKKRLEQALQNEQQALNAIQQFQAGATALGQQIQSNQFLLPSSFAVKVDANGLDVRDISAFVKNLNDLPLSKSFTLKVAVNGSAADKKILQGVFNNNVGPGQVSR